MQCNFKVVLFVCYVSVVSSANILDILSSWDLNEDSVVEKRDESPKNCVCDGPSCMCCVDFNFTLIDLGGPGCVRMKYISQEEGLAVNVSYGKSLLHSQQVKGPNPEPTCISLLSDLAQICARFSDLHPTGDGLKGCLLLEPRVLGDIQTQFNIGCFSMGPDGMKLDPSLDKNITSPLILTNGTSGESEVLNEEELIAAVNESAEQGLVFFGSLLGLNFGKPDHNATSQTETTDKVDTTSTPSTVRNMKKLSIHRQNEIIPKYSKYTLK